MGKIAFLFSGQGAQRVGMGKEFYDNFTTVRELFDRAEESRPGTLHQLFAGAEEELQRTENTQPCLYLADLAAAFALKESGVKADAVAGFSLGELPALAFGGAFAPLTGFRMACERGKLMAAAGETVHAGMAAIVKLPDEKVEELCKKYAHVYPVNYNCDGQLTVSGAQDELEQLYGDVTAAGGRSMPLKVSGGFHSPFMNEAAAGFGTYLQTIAFARPQLPVWSNRTAQPYGEDVATLLQEQINHPVRWKSIILSLYEQGFDTFVECGIGGVLRRLATKNIPTCRAYAVEDMAGLEKMCGEALGR